MKSLCIGIVAVAGVLGNAGDKDAWLKASLSYNYEWNSATLPATVRRDDYAADILFQESQANSLRGHILRSLASMTGPADAARIAEQARSIVDSVVSMNPNSDIVLPSVLLRANMGGEWLQEIRFENEELKTGHYPYLLCAISLEVLKREHEFVSTHHPNDLINGIVDGKAAEQPSINLPKMAFFREDRIKADLLNSLVALGERENMDRVKLNEIAQELNVSASVNEWARAVLE